jgi:hypothetical protein
LGAVRAATQGVAGALGEEVSGRALEPANQRAAGVGVGDGLDPRDAVRQ